MKAAGRKQPDPAVSQSEQRRRLERLASFVADLRRLAPPGPRGIRVRAVLDRLLERPESERPAALPAAFEAFARGCASEAADPEAVLDDLRLFVREHHPQLLDERAFAALVEGPSRRSSLMAWLLRENAGRLERSRDDAARRERELSRLDGEVRRLTDERRRLEEDLHRSRALADLGLGAAGLAHDFNNVLQAIVGHASLAIDRLPTDREERRVLEQVVAIARRAAELSTGLARWDRAEPREPRAVDLNAAVGEVLDLLSASAPARVRTTAALAPGLPRALAHPTDLRRVVLNLLLNAWQALDARPGSVRVSTGLDPSGRRPLVYIEVEDDGPGFDDAVREQLFVPFHSTRAEGCGLGLPTARALLERGEGGLEAASRPGGGARFRALLPVAEAGAGA